MKPTDYEHILFDLDGTLISSYMESSDRDFHSWHVLPGRLEMLRELRRHGVSISIVSNQAGVAFGYNTVADVTTKLILVAQALEFGHLDIYDGASEPRSHYGARREAGLITAHVAYEHPKATIEAYREEPDAIATNRRKPSPTMLQEAMTAHRGAVLMVGDREEDRLAAANAGVAFQWAGEFFHAES